MQEAAQCGEESVFLGIMRGVFANVVLSTSRFRDSVLIIALA
jgi:hypothetical protein